MLFVFYFFFLCVICRVFNWMMDNVRENFNLGCVDSDKSLFYK